VVASGTHIFRLPVPVSDFAFPSSDSEPAEDFGENGDCHFVFTEVTECVDAACRWLVVVRSGANEFTHTARTELDV